MHEYKKWKCVGNTKGSYINAMFLLRTDGFFLNLLIFLYSWLSLTSFAFHRLRQSHADVHLFHLLICASISDRFFCNKKNFFSKLLFFLLDFLFPSFGCRLVGWLVGCQWGHCLFFNIKNAAIFANFFSAFRKLRFSLLCMCVFLTCTPSCRWCFATPKSACLFVILVCFA